MDVRSTYSVDGEVVHFGSSKSTVEVDNVRIKGRILLLEDAEGDKELVRLDLPSLVPLRSSGNGS
jgi:hypothetical protein